jgi:hypothetical protein
VAFAVEEDDLHPGTNPNSGSDRRRLARCPDARVIPIGLHRYVHALGAIDFPDAPRGLSSSACTMLAGLTAGAYAREILETYPPLCGGELSAWQFLGFNTRL